MNAEFRVSSSYKNFIRTTLFIFLFMMIATLILMVLTESSRNVGWWVWVTFLLVNCILVLIELRTCNELVQINEHSISYLSKNHCIKTLAWENIQKIKNNTSCLVLYDQRGNKAIKLHSHKLDQFGQLRDLVINHTPHLQEKLSQIKVFNRAKTTHILSIVPILIGFMVFIHGLNTNLKELLMGLLLMSFFTYQLSKEIYRVSISKHSILITYPFKKQEIELYRITNILLKDMIYRSRAVLPHVIVETSVGEQIVFPSDFKEGSIALLESIKRVLRENTKVCI